MSLSIVNGGRRSSMFYYTSSGISYRAYNPYIAAESSFRREWYPAAPDRSCLYHSVLVCLTPGSISRPPSIPDNAHSWTCCLESSWVCSDDVSLKASYPCCPPGERVQEGYIVHIELGERGSLAVNDLGLLPYCLCVSQTRQYILIIILV